MTDGKRVSAPSCEAGYDDTGGYGPRKQADRRGVVCGILFDAVASEYVGPGVWKRAAKKMSQCRSVSRVVAWTTERAKLARMTLFNGRCLVMSEVSFSAGQSTLNHWLSMYIHYTYLRCLCNDSK